MNRLWNKAKFQFSFWKPDEESFQLQTLKKEKKCNQDIRLMFHIPPRPFIPGTAKVSHTDQLRPTQTKAPVCPHWDLGASVDVLWSGPGLLSGFSVYLSVTG